MDWIQAEKYNRVVNHLKMCFEYIGTDECMCDDQEFLNHCFKYYYINGMLFFYQKGAYINYRL